MNPRYALSLTFLRRQKWLVFILQQIGVFLLSFGFLMSIKLLTGKEIRGGKEAMGPIEFLGMITLFSGIIIFSVWSYRWSEGKDAPPLGLRPTLRGLLHLLTATCIAFLIAAGRKLLGFAAGSMQLTDSIGAHFSAAGVMLMLCMGLFSLTFNSVMEEISSRAVPVMLFRQHSILFRIFVPALFFAALHLAAEPFRLSSFCSHVVSGAVFAGAYLLTRNIWLASGIHTGGNLGVLFDSGRWQMGAIIKAEGTPVGPEWLELLIWSLLLLFTIYWLYRRDRKEEEPFLTHEEEINAEVVATAI